MSDIRILQLYLGTASSVELLETAYNFLAGGDFKYYRVILGKEDRIVCLFRDDLKVTNAFDRKVIDGVEDGYGLSIEGAYELGTGQIVDGRGSDSRALIVCVEDDSYYLIALRPD